MKLLTIALAVIVAAHEAAACSVSFDPDRLVSNPVYTSANGRFTAVVRRNAGLADFTKKRAADLQDDVYDPNFVTTALYDGGRIVAEIAVHRTDEGEIFVADSGRYIVSARHIVAAVCGHRAAGDDSLIAIYSSDGVHVGTLTLDDLFTPSDVLRLSEGKGDLVSFALRNDAIVVSVGELGEIPIDTATAVRLDLRRQFFTPPHAELFAGDEYPESHPLAPAACMPGVVRIASRTLIDHATTHPVPEYPVIAYKARISGMVRVEVTVAEDGSVVCIRSSDLPFGLSASATRALRAWSFRPFVIDGHPVKAVADVLVKFVRD